MRPPGGGTWRRQLRGTRRGPCCARTCRPRRPTGISPGIARSAIACCGWRWSPHRVQLRARPGPRRTRARHPHDPRADSTPLWRRAAGVGGGFSTAPAAELTSRLVCDGCHCMSFGKCGTYTPPTKGQFNMCNCTLPEVPHAEDPAPFPRLLQGRSQRDRRPIAGAQKRSRWTRRSPARSTTHPAACLESLERLGRGACWGRTPRRLELWSGRRGQLGEPAGLPGYSVVQASLRCCGMPASRARTSASR